MLTATVQRVHDVLRTNRSLRLKLDDLHFDVVPDITAPSAFGGHDFLVALHHAASVSWNRFAVHRRLREAFAQLVYQEPPTMPRSIPITRIDGLWGSKTTEGRNGEPLRSLAHLSETLYVPGELEHYRPDITFSTDEDFDRNTSSLLARFKESFKIDHHAWSDRYYVINEDGSHRMAAIYRQCIEQQRKFVMPCAVTTWRLSPQITQLLTRDYLGMVTNDDGYDLRHLLRQYHLEAFRESIDWKGRRVTVMLVPREPRYGAMLAEWIGALAHQGRVVDLNDFLIRRARVRPAQ